MTLDQAQNLFFAQLPNNRSFNSNASSTNQKQVYALPNHLRNNQAPRLVKPGVQNNEKHAPTKENKDN